MDLTGLETTLKCLDSLEQRYSKGDVTPREIAYESVIAVLLSGAEAVDQCLQLNVTRQDMEIFSYSMKALAYDLQLLEKGVG